MKSFFCKNDAYSKKTFAEQFPDLVDRYARWTERVITRQKWSGWILCPCDWTTTATYTRWSQWYNDQSDLSGYTRSRKAINSSVGCGWLGKTKTTFLWHDFNWPGALMCYRFAAWPRNSEYAVTVGNTSWDRDNYPRLGKNHIDGISLGAPKTIQ